MGIVWSRIVSILRDEERSAHSKSDSPAPSSSWKQICDVCNGRGWYYSGISKKVVVGRNKGMNLAKRMTETLGQKFVGFIWSAVNPRWWENREPERSKSEGEDASPVGIPNVASTSRRDSVQLGVVGGSRSDMNWVEAKEESAKKRQSKREISKKSSDLFGKNSGVSDLGDKRKRKGDVGFWNHSRAENSGPDSESWRKL